MASIIKIKRSGTNTSPATLKQGELAYSWASGAGGGKLYIGAGTADGNGDAPVVTIGGTYFTEMMDHTKGVLTASSAVITDADSKIDNLKVDNLDLNGNTISSTNVDGDIVIDPNGAGVVNVSSARVTGVAAPTAGGDATNKTYVDAADALKVSKAGDTMSGNLAMGNNNITGLANPVGDQDAATKAYVLSVAGASTISVVGDTGTDTVDITDSDLTFSGTDGIVTAVTDNEVTFSLSDGGIAAAKLENSGVTAGTYGSSSAIPVVTVNAQGIVDSVGFASISTSLDIAGDTGTDTVALADDTITFSGGTGLNTAVTDNTVTVNITNTGVSAGSYGSTTEIPVFSVNAQGQIDSAKNVSIATTLDIQGDAGTGGVDLLAEVLDIAGANGVNTSASGTTITVGLTDGGIANAKLANSTITVTDGTTPSDVALGGTLTFADGTGIDVTQSGGTVTVSGTDASTSAKGIASFSSGNFDVSVGAVSVKAGGITDTNLAGTLDLSGKSVTLANGEISNAELANSTIEINGTQISLGGSGSIDTDDINEGSVNQYYTTARADSDARYAITVTDNGGDGSISYEPLTGEISYTGPSAAEARAHFSGGTGVDITNGVVSIGQAVGTADSVTFSGLKVTNNVIIDGNLQVNGASTTVTSQSLEVTDNMIYMNAGESSGSPTASIDIGFAGNYNEDGTYHHAGFFRDATDATWKVFENYAPEPDADVQINTGHATFRLADFQADGLIGNTLTGKYLGFDSDFGTKTSDGITEGSTNLYYTTARVDSDLGDILTAGTGISITEGAGTITIAGTNAAADGATKGIAAFNSTNFAAASGVISAQDITLNGGTGSAAATLGEAFTITGNSAQGISTSATGTTVTVTAANATTSAKGVASFSSTNFSVASGAVSTNDITINGTSGSIAGTLGETLTITGSGPISTTGAGSSLTIAAANTTVSSKGVASFGTFADSAGDPLAIRQFTVTNGDVALSTVDGGSF